MVIVAIRSRYLRVLIANLEILFELNDFPKRHEPAHRIVPQLLSTRRHQTSYFESGGLRSGYNVRIASPKLLPSEGCCLIKHVTQIGIPNSDTQSTKPLITTNQSEWRAAIRPRYEQANRLLKTKILDEVVAVADIHRKHAIRLLCSNSTDSPIAAKLAGTKPRPRISDQETCDVGIACREASDRLCTKRLTADLPQLVASLERFGHLRIKDDSRRYLLTISASTIDKILAQTRVEKIGHMPQRPLAATAFCRSVPVRTFSDWNAPAPGYIAAGREGHLVSHSGLDASRSFVQTLRARSAIVGDDAPGVWLGVDLELWRLHAQDGGPLWARFMDDAFGKAGRLRGALEQWARQRSRPLVVSAADQSVALPIPLPVGREHATVVQSVLAQLKSLRDAIAGVGETK